MYLDKYLKYKLKYLKLKNFQLGGNKKLVLFHGSPCKLDLLEPRVPRGDNEFNTQKGVYLTDNLMDVMLYSMARDKERVNKGWAIKDGILYLREDKWNKDGYKLNEIGYVHCFTGYKSEQNPYNKSEYIIKRKIKPFEIKEITFDDIKNNIKYISREEFYNLEI
jgi:hypothetical protein